MDLHDGEQLIWRGHPAARANIGFYLRWGIVALLPVSIAGILKANDRGTGIAYWWWILISVALLVLVVVIDFLRRAATDYIVTTQRIRIRRGILSRREQSTIIEKVQNINTSQSLLDRLLQVGVVDFDTAGTEAAEASFRFTGVANPHGIVHRLDAYRLARQREGSPPGSTT